MLTIRDYDNNEYPLLAVKTVNEELNGNHDIELKVPQQRNNNLDLKLIDKLWEINYKTVDYKIMYIKQITKGDSFYLDIRATPLFYFEMDKQIIHENKDGHYTGKNAFDVVFQDSGYQYVLVDFVEAIQIEGFGKGETRLEMFKRLLDRFSLEFYIIGKTVYLKKLIGNDTNFMYKYKLNASNVSKSVDASNYFTHIKGFGNFEESAEDYLKQAKLRREYTSPLASVLGKYEGKPIVDGRVTDKETLDKMMKEAVEKSLEISIEGNLHDVRSIYKEAVPLIGDRVFLIDERINLEQEIRIQSLKQTFDVNDKLVNCEVTFGSESIRSRYKSNLQSVAKDFNSLLKGETKLPLWSLDEIARGMITKIHASENELKYGGFGIQAIDKNNPNNVFGLNSQGWYISTDGGRTARTVATAEGIVADAITTGTLRAITVDGVEIYGSYIESRKDKDEYVFINSGAVMSHGKFTRTWAGETDTAKLEMGLYNGQLRVRNKDTGYRLYLTERGLSTSMEGAIDQFTSGTLEFHSQRFNPNSRGVTLHSSYGAVAMLSDYSTAVIRSNLTANIESNEYSVYIRPFRNSRSGLNEFQFYVKANESSSDTDGALLFGNITGGATHGSGIRFSKGRGSNTVYATNINGDMGTGNFHAKEFKQASSLEFKTNIENVVGIGLKTINDLTVVEYDYIVDVEHGVQDRQLGFISEYSDSIATKERDAINLYKLSSYLTLAVQELSTELNKLKEQINGE